MEKKRLPFLIFGDLVETSDWSVNPALDQGHVRP